MYVLIHASPFPSDIFPCSLKRIRRKEKSNNQTSSFFLFAPSFPIFILITTWGKVGNIFSLHILLLGLFHWINACTLTTFLVMHRKAGLAFIKSAQTFISFPRDLQFRHIERSFPCLLSCELGRHKILTRGKPGCIIHVYPLLSTSTVTTFCPLYTLRHSHAPFEYIFLATLIKVVKEYAL